MLFHDRHDAGRRLAGRLSRMHLSDPIVLALPRGGVPVGYEVARALGCPLDVLVVRKIGAFSNPEFGIGAVTADDPPYYDEKALAALALSEDELRPIAERERQEVNRRAALYRQGRPESDVRGKSVIIADDGVATGGTAHAALRSVRHRLPSQVILAVPVCAIDTSEEFAEDADELVCLHAPEQLIAVGAWYEDFSQLSDQDVIRQLGKEAG